jgi:hypothetical protein
VVGEDVAQQLAHARRDAEAIVEEADGALDPPSTTSFLILR